MPSRSPRGSGSSWPAVGLAIASIAVAVSADAEAAPVTLPLVAALASALLFVVSLTLRRRREIAWCEIGFVYVAIVTLYAVYPLLGYLVLDQTFTPYSDQRLQRLAPGAEEIGRIGWLYVAHLFAFAVTYLVVRRRLPAAVSRPRSPRVSVGLAVVGLYVAIQGFALVVGLFYDTSAETYVESYVVARRLPLIVAQALGHLKGATYPLSIALLVVLFTRYPRSRWVLIAWILLTGVVTAARLGSRTEFALFASAIALTYHLLVRPISPRLMVVGSVVGLAAFVAFGVIRGGAALSADRPWHTLPFAYSTEFEVLFTNALHLERIRQAGAGLSLPGSLVFGDLAGLLPQQIAPYTKFDASSWYVTTFFPDYAAVGGGLAFGLIAESVLTGGWVSAMIRGMILGTLCAGIHRLYVQRGRSFWMFVFYVWITTSIYQAFRAGTFYPVVLFVYRFLLVVIVVQVAATLLEYASRSPRSPRSLPDVPQPA